MARPSIKKYPHFRGVRLTDTQKTAIDQICGIPPNQKITWSDFIRDSIDNYIQVVIKQHPAKP